MAITDVGTPTTGSAINGADITLSLPTGLQQNDVVVVECIWNAHSAGATSSSGWTAIAALDPAGTNPSIKVFRKVMGSVPDTSIVLTGTGNGADSSSAIAIAKRGVDTTTMEDGVTPTTATNTSGSPDPPSITPNTTGAEIIICGGVNLVDTTGTGAPSGYTNFTQQSSSDNNSETAYLASKSNLTGGVPEDPGTFTGVTSGRWVAASIVLKPAADVTVNFGWFEQAVKPLFTKPTPPLDAFVRPIRDGLNFTTPTPSILGWFEPFGLPAPGKWQRGSVAWSPQPFTLTTEIGWFEPYSRPPKAIRKEPADAFVRAAIDFAIAPPIGWLAQFSVPPKAKRSITVDYEVLGLPQAAAQTTTDIGWFDPFDRPPPASKPAGSIVGAPQQVASAPTLTTDIGWFVPFPKAPPPSKPLSAIAMDPQPIATAPTLTTDIGWFVPFNRPPTIATIPPQGWSSFFGQRPDLGIAWFEPFTLPPRAVKALAAAQAIGVPLISLSTYGWFEPYVVPRTIAKAPRDAASLAAQVTAARSFGWYFNFSLAPRALKLSLLSWPFTPQVFDATPVPIVSPPGGTSKRDVALARRMRARALRMQELEDAIAAGDKAHEHLRALALRYKSEGVDFQELMNDWFVSNRRAASEVDEDEAIDILLLSM